MDKHEPDPRVASDTQKMNNLSQAALLSIKKYPFKVILENSYFQKIPNFGPKLYKNGSTYSGQYFKGSRCGVGQESYPDGSGFTGNWEYDKKKGKGALYFANGSVYLGNFANNKFSGQGKFYSTEGNYTYEGTFSNGLKEGQGNIVYKD